MKWQPIETAPRDSTDILLLADDSAIEGKWDTKEKEWDIVWLEYFGCGCCAGLPPKLTHWCPLPTREIVESFTDPK